jgi:hypothetical protein
LELHGKKSRPPYYEDVADKMDGTEIFVCSLGTEGSIFTVTDDHEKYGNYLAIRFSTEEIKQQYLNIDPALLCAEFKKDLGGGHLTPYRWYTIVSKFMDLKKKRYKFGIKPLTASLNCHTPYYKRFIDQFHKDDIFICAIGKGCMFRLCPYDKYNNFLWLRFYDKALREQYLKLDPLELEHEHIAEYGVIHAINPSSFYTIVSKHLNLNPE